MFIIKKRKELFGRLNILPSFFSSSFYEKAQRRWRRKTRKAAWWFLPFLYYQSTTIYQQLRKRHCAPCSLVVLSLFYDVFPLTLLFDQFLRAIRRKDFFSFLCFLRGNSEFGQFKGSGNRIRRFRSRARRSWGINLCVRTVVTGEEFLESKNFEEDNGSWLRHIEKDE